MPPWARGLGMLALFTAAPSVAAPTVDTGSGIDADGDGVTVAQGDCDDSDDTVAPDLAEICGDQRDNDCDGLLDEACDERAQMASLRGGGCSGGVAVVFLGPLLLGRRRRRTRA